MHKYVYICVYILYTYIISTHNGILFSHEQEGNPAVCDNLDES